MSVALSVALATARTWLNDDAVETWSDASLIPKAQEAHRELQVQLWNAGSPAVRGVSSPIAVASGGASQPTLPSDLLTPFKLVEYDTATGSLATAVPMTEVFDLPNRTTNALLQVWAWKEETIYLLGASTNRTIVIYYRRQIPIPVLTTDLIGLLFGELYIGARTAAMAAGSTGNKDLLNILTQVCKDNFSRVVSANRGQQNPPNKP